MKKSIWLSALLCCCAANAFATPSTQIWIPSTDIQKFKTGHLNIDTYLTGSNEPSGVRKAPVSVIGPTFGVLPYEKIQAEVGFDIIQQGNTDLDSYPLYFHGKVATPEKAWFEESPAVAVGLYNAGTKSDKTNQNVLYGLAAKTFPVVGRLSGGYYTGNDKVLVDANGAKANNGLLLSWDRTMTEISEKLWMAVDYQGGKSALGALNFGLSWAFSPNTSVILGYDIYNNSDVAGRDSVTMQVDINFP